VAGNWGSGEEERGGAVGDSGPEHSTRGGGPRAWLLAGVLAGV
jgi:hypothetical protein